MTAFRVEKDGVMLAARDHYGRHQNIRLAVSLRLQKCDDGKLAQIEFLLPHQRFERLCWRSSRPQKQSLRAAIAVPRFSRRWCSDTQPSRVWRVRAGVCFGHRSLLLPGQRGIKSQRRFRENPIAIFSGQHGQARLGNLQQFRERSFRCRIVRSPSDPRSSEFRYEQREEGRVRGLSAWASATVRGVSFK